MELFCILFYAILMYMFFLWSVVMLSCSEQFDTILGHVPGTNQHSQEYEVIVLDHANETPE